jgi:hypothetical protein
MSTRRISKGRNGLYKINPEPPPPPPSSLAWASDWSRGGTGVSTTAISDDGLWPTVGPTNADDLEVLAATGLDFPGDMANVLAIRYKGGTARGVVVENNSWDSPAVDEDIYFRVYFRSQLLNAAQPSSQHPLGSGAGDLLGGYALVHRVNANPFRAWVTTNYPPDLNQIHRWETDLSINTTYRLEWHFRRTALDRFTEDIRIYDSADNLILSNPNFYCNWSGHNHYLNSNPNQYIEENTANVAWAQARITHQGFYDFTNDAENRIYWGGFAVSRADWCGPYILGEGP